MKTMKSKGWVLPYKAGSNSVRGLLEELRTFKGIKPKDSKYRSKEGDLIINWGRTDCDLDLSKAEVLNPVENLRVCTNKKNFFEFMSRPSVEGLPRVPSWTLDKNEALQWVNDGKTVFVRTKLAGHSGDGIVQVETVEDLETIPDRSLMVLYVPKKHEYRIHFFKGGLFDFQRKAKRNDHDDPNWRIRSHENGFVYTRNGIEIPKDVRDQAQLCANSLNGIVDFGGIDIIYNEWHNKAYVLEVNTAPGLEGQTLYNYADQFKRYMNK